MLKITGKQLQDIRSINDGVIVLDGETAVTVPIEMAAGRPILLYAHQVIALLEENRWDADEAAALLSTKIDMQRRGDDPSWDRRRQ